MIGFQIIEAIITFIEALTGLLIITKILGNGRPKYIKCILAASIIMTFVWVQNQYNLFSTFTTIIAILSFTVSACLIYKANIIDSLVLSIDYMILLYIIDFLALSFLGIAYKNNKMALILVSSFSTIRIQLLILSKALLLTIYYIISKYLFNKIELQTWKSLLVVFVGIGGVYYLVKSAFLQLDIDIVFISGLLLALVILGIYSLNQYFLYIQENSKLMSAVEKNNLLVIHYESIIENYYRNQSFYHDLKNQHLVIKNYLNNKEYKKAEEYMERLKYVNDTNLRRNWTGNESLDILLTCKKIEADRLNIDVNIIANPVNFQLTEQEIISLIGNLFDNAIEACSRVDVTRRWIQIIIRKVEEMIFIKVINTYKEVPQLHEGRFLTKKENKSIHGLGMTSIKLTVDKYQGNLEVSYDKETFSVIISFFN